MYLPMRWMLFGLTIAVLLAMAIPGGVVVEGQLPRNPAPGTSTPFSITVTKGGLEYFGRILISLPEDCRIVRIRNTLDLAQIEVSEPMLAEVKAKPECFSIMSPARPFVFDRNGSLSPLAHDQDLAAASG